MTELQLARGATKWLRSFGLAVVGLLLAGVMAITSFLSAQSAADGSDSEIDFAAALSATSSTTLLGATYANVPQPTNFDPYSIQLWVNPGPVAGNNSTTVDRALINLEHKFAIVSRANTWQYYTGNGTSWYSGPTDTGIPIRAGQWTHIGLVMTATDIHFYVNGQHVHSQGSRQSSGANNSSASGKYFGIGNWTSAATNVSSGSFFDCQVDEVRLWQSDRGLQMSTDMHTRPTSPTTPAAYWDFNQGSGNVVHDRYGTANLSPQTSIVFQDVKRTSYVAGGDTVITFPRTYLPGIGGWKVPSNANSFRALVVAGGGGADLEVVAAKPGRFQRRFGGAGHAPSRMAHRRRLGLFLDGVRVHLGPHGLLHPDLAGGPAGHSGRFVRSGPNGPGQPHAHAHAHHLAAAHAQFDRGAGAGGHSGGTGV